MHRRTFALWLAFTLSAAAIMAGAGWTQDSATYETQLQRGSVELQAGDAAAALAAAQAAVLASPERWDGFALAGRALLSLKRYEDAADAVSKAIERAPPAEQAMLRDLRRQCALAESGVTVAAATQVQQHAPAAVGLPPAAAVVAAPAPPAAPVAHAAARAPLVAAKPPAPAAHAATVATTTAPPALGHALSTEGQLLDRVVAVVNDGVVLQSQLDEQIREITTRLRDQNVTLPPEDVLRSQVLDQLVLQALQDQRADKAGIKVSDEQVNSALAEIAKQQGVAFDELPARMAQDGIDYPNYREDLRREIAREILRDQDVLQRIPVTPRELDQYMANQQKVDTSLYEYDASNILIPIAQDASPDQLAQASKLAHDVDDNAKHGEDFAKLAVTYSQAQTALQGGELGWRKGSELPTFLADVIARLQPGAVSDVIQTSSGFHIVKLNAKRTAGGPQIVQQVHLRHILIKPTELQDDATARQKLERMREQIMDGKEEFAVLAKTNSQDAGSAINGGDLGWTELSAYVPAFAAVAGSLQVGQISEPVHTQFGWHIVQLLGRRDFDNSKDAARERAFAALRGSRADEATELWLQQLKDNAYVKLQL